MQNRLLAVDMHEQQVLLEGLPGAGIGVPADEADRLVVPVHGRPVGVTSRVELPDLLQGEVLDTCLLVDDEGEEGEGDGAGPLVGA